jgi:hypothetical protein
MEQSIEMRDMDWEFDDRDNEQHKRRQCSWLMIFCIVFITLAIIAVIVSLLLKFVVFATDNSESSTITNAPPTTTTAKPGKV